MAMTKIANYPTIEQFYPDTGIFATLKSDFSGHEWLDDTTAEQAAYLDEMIRDTYYNRHLNRAGLKVQSDINLLCGRELLIHGTEWDRLYTSYKAEYNPIWNVDGTETTTETRDLKQTHTGTDTTAATGTDSTTHSGTDTTEATGTDSTKHTGTDIYKDSGTDSTTHTGTDTIAASGTDSTTHSGTDTTAATGTDTTTTKHNINGFDSASAVPSDDSTQSLENGKTLSETRDLTDATAYGRTDTQTRDTTDATEYGKENTNTKDLTDATTYGRTDTNTKNLTDSTEYGRTDTQTKNLTDSDTGTITTTHKRGGNIGVTMTQQMLVADRDYWTNVLSQFYRIVIKDVIDDITFDIYVIGSGYERDGLESVNITALYESGTQIADITVSTDSKVGIKDISITDTLTSGTPIAIITSETDDYGVTSVSVTQLLTEGTPVAVIEV